MSLSKRLLGVQGWRVEGIRYPKYESPQVNVDLTDIAVKVDKINSKECVQKMRMTVFQAEGYIRNSVVSKISSVIPYRTYPHTTTTGRKVNKDPHANRHGMLRGQHYGPLADDVKRSVRSDASGGTVSIFSRPSHPNRWNVLMWLNDGTNERGSKRSTYSKVRQEGQKNWVWHGHKMQSNSRIVAKEFDHANGGNRGRIEAQNFFLPAANAGLAQATSYIEQQIPQDIISSMNS